MRERMSVSKNVVDHGLRFSFIMIYVVLLSWSFLDSRTNDASMRNVWATVGFSNWETRGGPFGMLPEGS